MRSFEVIYYREPNGATPIQKWFEHLDKIPAGKIYMALARMESGNFSDSKHLKGGLWERRIHSGPGFRFYYAMHKRRHIILLCGGTKRTQIDDIRKARRMWYEFKTRSN
ncbi:MAG: type II toxin-antitoxin system RelE/ParE family toxin [Gammaproteobacteria bacterium]|nr:type II toxin-antitoxin system RelE/ParE family toxin [Gammaproteobacteria bacterium]